MPDGESEGAMTDQPDLKREFRDREELIAYVRQQFPAAAAVDDHVAPTPGGRAEAERRLARIKPKLYAATRNDLDGAVTRLSAFIRHGVLSLTEVRAYALQQVDDPADAEKLIQELAWRDYWQRLYASLGDGIWKDREAYKTGFRAEDYADDLPEDIREGRTGLACIDAFISELYATGYLHNHARMWLAAYVVHWRRRKWQAGARWFLMHLLDGDPASNNLSWQWVASTFSHKPYLFNRENLERYTGGRYCRTCPVRGRCAFEGSYEALSARLFPNRPPDADERPNSGSWHRGQGRGRKAR
jgi:deoxyribodipyrimidine photo-lyase